VLRAVELIVQKGKVGDAEGAAIDAIDVYCNAGIGIS
jgi:hypothetical protein